MRNLRFSLLTLGFLPVISFAKGLDARAKLSQSVKPATVAGNPTGESAYAPILLDVEHQSETLAAKRRAKPGPTIAPLLPHRVYLVYLPKEANWFYALTDGAAAFAEPAEVFRVHSVLPGNYLGAKTPHRNYMLAGNRLWAPTSRAREEFYWVYPSGLVPDGRIKIVEYEAQNGEPGK